MENQNNNSISVIILTLNEEANLRYAIDSITNFSDDIHIVDSGSNDRTLPIAEEFNVNIHNHPWTNWAQQRNWALENCPLKYKWALFLDADEQLTAASAEEISKRTQNAPDECHGFYLAFAFYFIGKRVRNAMNPHLRLVRKDKVRWEVCGAREYCSAPSDSPVIKARLKHFDHRGLKFWISKQLRNAELEAEEKFYKRRNSSHKADIKDKPGELKLRHLLRTFVETKCPIFVFPTLSFLYRLIFKTSIRDGWAGLIYAFLFGFWYPLMIDIKYMKIYFKKTECKQ